VIFCPRGPIVACAGAFVAAWPDGEGDRLHAFSR